MYVQYNKTFMVSPHSVFGHSTGQFTFSINLGNKQYSPVIILIVQTLLIIMFCVLLNLNM